MSESLNDIIDLRMSKHLPGFRCIVGFFKDEGRDGLVLNAETHSTKKVGQYISRSVDKNNTEEWVPVNNLQFPEVKTKKRLAPGVFKIDESRHFFSTTLFQSYEDAEKYIADTDYTLVQWPLKVNGVEQWTEVEE